MDNKYTRVVIKISGEALAGENGFGLNNAVIAGVVEQIAKVRNMGIQIGIIIGGGNFWRGRQGAERLPAIWVCSQPSSTRLQCRTLWNTRACLRAL